MTFLVPYSVSSFLAIVAATAIVACFYDINLATPFLEAQSTEGDSSSSSSSRKLAAKSRQHRAEFNQNYAIQAFMCRGGDDNGRIVKSLSQGSMVTLCVQPSEEHKGVRVASIDSFVWHKTREKDGDGEKDSDSLMFRQEAIQDGAAFDMFTTYKGCQDRERSFCSFSSLLKADFYRSSEGYTSGSGTATISMDLDGSTEPETRSVAITWK